MVMTSRPPRNAASDEPLQTYSDAVARFDHANAAAFLPMDATGSMNAAAICCDRHASDPGKIALRHRTAAGKSRDWTFAELRHRSSQLARVFARIGVERGDRVAGLLPRCPELLVTNLAAWRLGAVAQPLFTAFGPKADRTPSPNGGCARDRH